MQEPWNYMDLFLAKIKFTCQWTHVRSLISSISKNVHKVLYDFFLFMPFITVDSYLTSISLYTWVRGQGTGDRVCSLYSKYIQSVCPNHKGTNSITSPFQGSRNDFLSVIYLHNVMCYYMSLLTFLNEHKRAADCFCHRSSICSSASEKYIFERLRLL